MKKLTTAQQKENRILVSALSERLGAQSRQFLNDVKAIMENYSNVTAALPIYCARKLMYNNFGRDNVSPILEVRETSKLDDNLNNVKEYYVTLRFHNPNTCKFYFEQVWILSLSDKDFKDLGIEKS